MSESTEANKYRRRLPIWLFLGLILLAAILFGLSRCRDQERPLKPLRPVSTAGEMATVQGRAVSIRFPELNEAPRTLRNQRIQVSGAFSGLETADCPRPRGPNSRWALIADDLQLDAVGFEQVLRLVPPRTLLTIEGVWRLYEGSAGCGKNATVQSVWYLEVDRIVEPNPLLGSNPSPEPQEPTATSMPAEAAPSAPTATPVEADALATSTATATATMTPAARGTSIPTATGTPVATRETPGATGNQATPSPTTTTVPTSTATPGGTGTVQPSATPTSVVATSQPTGTSQATIPAAATATPGGYPGPDTTPGAGTATPAGYP